MLAEIFGHQWHLRWRYRGTEVNGGAIHYILEFPVGFRMCKLPHEEHRNNLWDFCQTWLTPFSLHGKKIPMTLFFVLPQSFDLCLLCHAFDGMRRWELAFSLRRAAHGLTPGVVCEPNRSMDDMKSTWGVYEGAYTCWVAILWMQVQNPKVIGSFILTIYLRANKK
jgi:hypothetical protein